MYQECCSCSSVPSEGGAVKGTVVPVVGRALSIARKVVSIADGAVFFGRCKCSCSWQSYFCSRVELFLDPDGAVPVVGAAEKLFL